MAHADRPAPTSDHAFYLAGFQAVSSPDLFGLLWLGLRDPHSRKYPAFESFGLSFNDAIGVDVLNLLLGLGVDRSALLDLNSHAYAAYKKIMNGEVNSLASIYGLAHDGFFLAHHVRPHIRLLSAAYRHQGKNQAAAVNFLRRGKANRDTAKAIDRSHVFRARKAFEEDVARWEQARHCQAMKAEGFDPLTLFETFDNGILNALVVIRQRAAEPNSKFRGLLGKDLFAAIEKHEQARGRHMADGLLRTAQRLDEEAGSPFRTIHALSLMACCMPLGAFDQNMDARISA